MPKSELDLSRRALVTSGGALLGATLLPKGLRAQGAAPELSTLRSTSKSWLWAAEDYANAAGFFTQAGVKVTSNASNRGTNIAALQGGGVDIVLGDPGEASRARSQNLAIKTFVSTVNRYASHVVLKKDLLAKAGVDETSPADKKIAMLKGLKLGTTGPGAAPDALFRYLASQGGLNPERDMQLVTLQGGGPGMLAALQQNAIDGFCLSSPTADLAVQRQSCGYLFQMALNPPPFLAEYQYIIASAGEDTIKTKRDALVRYAKGIALALRSISAEQDKFKAWAKDWFEGMDPDIFESAYANNSRIYFADPTPKESLFAKNLEFISTVNKLMGAEAMPATVTFQAMVDPTIAQDAMKGL